MLNRLKELRHITYITQHKTYFTILSQILESVLLFKTYTVNSKLLSL